MALYVFTFFHMAIGLKAFPMANFVKGILYGPLFVQAFSYRFKGFSFGQFCSGFLYVPFLLLLGFSFGHCFFQALLFFSHDHRFKRFFLWPFFQVFLGTFIFVQIVHIAIAFLHAFLKALLSQETRINTQINRKHKLNILELRVKSQNDYFPSRTTNYLP